jgi:hypothetical protein
VSWSRRRHAGPEGVQEPRVHVRPLADDWTSSDDALFLIAGLTDAYEQPLIELMPWQELVVWDTFARYGQEGLWAANDLGLIVARQNGKGGVLEAIVLCHLLLFGARRVLWTAQLQKTSDDAHKRMAKLFTDCPELNDLLDKSTRDGGITYGSGTKTIRLKTGQEIHFFTRTSASGRGLFADVLILDESYDLTDDELAALGPTVKTAANAQLLYTSTPPDEDVHPNGIVLSRMRKNCLAQKPEDGFRRGWIEWSVPEKTNHELREFWPMANPSLGYLFTMETLVADLGRMGVRKFRVEDLCSPDYWPDPDVSEEEDRPIPTEVWRDSSDPQSEIVGPYVLGIDQTPGDRRTSLVAVGRREDGRKHAETVASADGVDWVVDLMLHLIVAPEPPEALVIDAMSPAGSLLPRLRAEGIEPYVTGTREMIQACQSYADDLATDQHRHRGNDTPLNEGADIVRWRNIGTEGGRAFARKGYGDISAQVAAALAGFGLDAFVAAGGPTTPPAAPVAVPRETVTAPAQWARGGSFDPQSVGF